MDGAAACGILAQRKNIYVTRFLKQNLIILCQKLILTIHRTLTSDMWHL